MSPPSSGKASKYPSKKIAAASGVMNKVAEAFDMYTILAFASQLPPPKIENLGQNIGQTWFDEFIIIVVVLISIIFTSGWAQNNKLYK